MHYTQKQTGYHDNRDLSSAALLSAGHHLQGWKRVWPDVYRELKPLITPCCNAQHVLHTHGSVVAAQSATAATSTNMQSYVLSAVKFCDAAIPCDTTLKLLSHASQLDKQGQQTHTKVVDT